MLNLPDPLPRPDSLALSQPGSRAIGVTTLKLKDESRQRPLIVEVWYPTDGKQRQEANEVYKNIPWLGVAEPVSFGGRALRDAPITAQTAPVVIYAHGAPGSRLQSTYLCEHLASHGFVVAAIDFTKMTYGDREDQAYVSGLLDRPLDVSFVLSELARQKRFSEVADTENAAIIGYSFGGYTALASCGAGLDFEQLKEACLLDQKSNIAFALDFQDMLEPARGKNLGFQGDARLKAALVMAPWNAPILNLPQVSLPLFVAVGELDAVAPYRRDALRVFQEVSSAEKHLLVFERGGHNIFTNPCLPATRQTSEAWEHCSDPVWDKERVNDIIKHVALAFLRQHLLGEDTMAQQVEDIFQESVSGVRLQKA